jgi:hypothetical protein
MGDNKFNSDTVAATTDPPRGPAVDPLITLLRFIEAMPTRDVFAPVDAGVRFAAMRRQMPDLEPTDLVFAGTVANEFGKQLRAMSWRLRGGQPKKPEPSEDRLARAGARRFDPKDPRALALPLVVAQWREHLGLNTKWKVKQVIARASGVDDLYAALFSVASDGRQITSQRLGTWLSRTEGLTIDGMVLICAEVKFGYPRWTLIEVPPA